MLLVTFWPPVRRPSTPTPGSAANSLQLLPLGDWPLAPGHRLASRVAHPPSLMRANHGHWLIEVGGSGRPALSLGSALVQFMLCTCMGPSLSGPSPRWHACHHLCPLRFRWELSPSITFTETPLSASASRKPQPQTPPFRYLFWFSPFVLKVTRLDSYRDRSFNHVQIIDCRSENTTQLSQVSVQTFPRYHLYLFNVYFILKYMWLCSVYCLTWSLLGSAGKESACNVENLGSIPGSGRFPWRRERLPIPGFWPGEVHGL